MCKLDGGYGAGGGEEDMMFVVVCVCGCIERCCGGIGHRAGWAVVVVARGYTFFIHVF